MGTEPTTIVGRLWLTQQHRRNLTPLDPNHVALVSSTFLSLVFSLSSGYKQRRRRQRTSLVLFVWFTVASEIVEWSSGVSGGCDGSRALYYHVHYPLFLLPNSILKPKFILLTCSALLFLISLFCVSISSLPLIRRCSSY